MIRKNEDNLNELFAGFGDADEAEKAAEDFKKVSQLLDTYPAPKPDTTVLRDIRQNISSAIAAKRATTFRHTFYRLAAVAAMIAVVAGIALNLLYKKTTPLQITSPVIANAVWQSDDITSDDVDIAVIAAEIDQIESEIYSLSYGSNGTDMESEIDDLEMEINQIAGQFWKG